MFCFDLDLMQDIFLFSKGWPDFWLFCHPMKASFPPLPSTEKVFISWLHLHWRKTLKEEK